MKRNIRARPRGIVTFEVRRHGKLLYRSRSKNLFLNAGLPALASLLGGVTPGEFIAAIGFGSGNAPPTLADAALTAPMYYKAIGAPTFDGLGSVTMAWTLVASGGDAGAIGITIQELALFGNTGSLSLPRGTAPAPILARKVIAPLAFGAGMSISGTWELTF